MDRKFAAKIKGQRVIDGALLDGFQQARDRVLVQGSAFRIFFPRWVKLRWGPFAGLNNNNNNNNNNNETRSGNGKADKVGLNKDDIVHLRYHHDEEQRKKG